MKKLFVSVPMKGRTETDIKASIAKMKKIAEAYEEEELELIDSYIEEEPPVECDRSVWYLSKSLERLAAADIFIGITDTTGWPGCKIESDVARLYDIKRYSVDNTIVIDYTTVLSQKLAVLTSSLI